MSGFYDNQPLSFELHKIASNCLHLDPFMSLHPPKSTPSLLSLFPNCHQLIDCCIRPGRNGRVGQLPIVCHCPHHHRSRRGRVVRRPCQPPSIPLQYSTMSLSTKVTTIRPPSLERRQLPHPSLRHRRLIVASCGFSPLISLHPLRLFMP